MVYIIGWYKQESNFYNYKNLKINISDQKCYLLLLRICFLCRYIAQLDTFFALKIACMTFIILISLFFGVSQKLADALNEHGTVLFKYANLLFGLLFGLFGLLLITYNKVFLEFYLGLVLYWLIAGKLDFFNHQLTASIMLLSAFVVFNYYDPNIVNVYIVIVFSFLFSLGKKIVSRRWSNCELFFIKKYHHLVFALCIGIWFSNIYITASIIVTMLGIIFTIKALKQYKNYTD